MIGNNFIWWFGVVEDNDDPLQLGRVRVRIFKWHEDDLTAIPTGNLHWAQPLQPITSAAVGDIGQTPTGILRGSWVVGFFIDGNDGQFPMIMGTLAGVPSNFADTSKGFNDPEGTYPYRIDEVDVNRLARPGNTHPVVEFRDAFIDDLTNEPIPDRNTLYPFNKVFETESGHLEEWDDSPDNERYMKLHRSGTMEEIHEDGTKVNRVFANNYSIVHGDDFVRVRGNVNIFIDGDSSLYIRGNSTVQVDNDVTFSIGGKLDMNVKEDITIKTDGDFKVDATNIELTSKEMTTADVGSKWKFVNDGAAESATILDPKALVELPKISYGRDVPTYESPGGGNGVPPKANGGPAAGSKEVPLVNTSNCEELGSLSERYESNGDPCVIGFDKVGGYSYGQYQIATRTGTFGNYMNYLKKNNPDQYKTLQDAGGERAAKTKTPAFEKAWKSMCKEGEKSQHDFIQATHYEPARRRILKSCGIDVNDYSCAFQNVIWSTAVQHGAGGASKILKRGVKRTGKDCKDLTEEELINALYDERGAKKSDGNLKYFSKSNQNVQNGVSKRFDQERRVAVAQSKEQSAKV